MNELFVGSTRSSGVRNRTNVILLWRGFGGEMVALYRKGFIKPETLNRVITDYLIVVEESMLNDFLNDAPRTPTFRVHLLKKDAGDLLVKGSSIEDKRLRSSYIDYVTKTFKPGPLVFTRQNIKDLNEYNPNLWKRVQAFKVKGVADKSTKLICRIWLVY